MFDCPISTEAAYVAICILNEDTGGRDAISARGWLKYSSYMANEVMYLQGGSYIFRHFTGQLYFVNPSARTSVTL